MLVESVKHLVFVSESKTEIIIGTLVHEGKT